MQSLLAKVTAADIRTDPFPHIVITDALPADLYQQLSAGFPPFEVVGWAGGAPPPSNSRYALTASQIHDDARLSAVWKEFTAYHSSPAFFHQVVDLFAGFWPDALLRAVGGDLKAVSTGQWLRDRHADARILQDARIEINTPVTKRPSASRGAHLDTLNRIFTGLLYLRHPDDDAVGGDLELHRYRKGVPQDIDVFQFPDDAVEVVATVPYRPNTLVMFANGLHAIHGVGVRGLTPWTRRYVFISAEIEEQWLSRDAT